VLTPLVQQQIEARAKAAGKTVEQAKNELIAEKQPMLQFSTPENVGALAVFLAGDAAATITGSAYSIDGGWDGAVSARKPKPKKINLALQGGGAHGAFTWGVLDQLLEDERIDIEGISGTSAGAVNAVMLADGLARGGPEAARQRLADFWRAASLDGNLPDLQRSVIDRLFSFTPYEGSPVQAWFNAVSHYMSPYDLNPLNINPLRDLIERFVDFDAVRACREISLFISATNVHTGRLRVFPQDKITPT
jgi:NTE family protein